MTEQDLVRMIAEQGAWEDVDLNVKVTEENDETLNESQETEEEVNEEAEAHICPLCESDLEEALTEEQLATHVQEVADLLEEADAEEAEELVEEDDDSEDFQD